eukprot:350110-Amphidinium_carterae.1
MSWGSPGFAFPGFAFILVQISDTGFRHGRGAKKGQKRSTDLPLLSGHTSLTTCLMTRKKIALPKPKRTVTLPPTTCAVS